MARKSASPKSLTVETLKHKEAERGQWVLAKEQRNRVRVINHPQR